MCGRMILVAILAMTLAGCAGSVPRDGEFSDVQQAIDTRLSQRVYWYQGGAEDEKVRQALTDMLQQPLTLDAAVQIGLLNNQHLQAEYERLGVAQADLVQAGLLSNPTLFSSVRFPTGSGRTNLEFEVAQSFLDILLRPARQRLARAEFERAKLSVSNTIMDFSMDVIEAWRDVQAAAKLVEVLEVINESAQAGYEMAQRFDEAGNLTPVKLSQHRAIAAEASAELTRARTEHQQQRDRLSRLLALTGSERDWTMTAALPELPDNDPALSESLQTARAQRLDLAELNQTHQQLIATLEMTQNYRYIGGAKVGVNAERETDGSSRIGPNFSVELPIFDQRQAGIARLESLLYRSEASRRALEADIHSDVTDTIHQLQGVRKLAEQYRDEVIPAGEAIVRYTQREQNYMLTDVFDLLLVQRQARSAYRGYIEALRDYWIARAELQRAMGTGELSVARAPNSEASPVDAPVDDVHRHE